MRRHLRAIVGVVLSVALLWWALRDVSWPEVADQISRADPFLFVLSILLTVGGFLFRAVRWGILLRPVAGAIAFRPRMAATFIGFAANNVLPARVGEFARAFSLSRIAPVSTAAALGTMVIERVLDGIVLIGLLFLAMSRPDFPDAGGADLRTAATAAAVVIAVFAIGIGLAVVAPRIAARSVHSVSRFLPHGVRLPVIAALRSFSHGLVVLRDLRLFGLSAILALGQWVFLALSFLVAFRAFGIENVPFSGAIFLQSLISLAVAIPSSPGFFGPFEAAARLGLGLWEVPADQAISFAIGFHIGGFIPVTVIGAWYLSRMNIRWADVSRGEEKIETDLDANPPLPPSTIR